MWNPQAAGSPNVRGNQPQDYYPGRAWVDYVATDIYEQGGHAAWSQNEAFYQRYRRVRDLLFYLPGLLAWQWAAGSSNRPGGTKPASLPIGESARPR